MKICPNCGAENEDNALNCILCELEFDLHMEVTTESDTYEEANHDIESANESDETPVSKIAPNSAKDDEYAVAGNRKLNGKWIAIIAILIVALACVIGGIVFMQKNKEKTGKIGSDVKNESSNESSEDDTEENESITSTATVSTMTATSSITSAVTTSESKADIEYPEEYSSEEISAMFSAYIAENPDPNRNYKNEDYGYALIDLNNDGVQELLITQEEVEAGSPGVMGIFNINNNSLDSIWISDFRTLGRLCENNCIYTSDIYGQGYGIFIYKYSSGGSLEEVESIEYNASTGSDKALHNGREVSQTEAEEILAKYNAKKIKTKQLKFEEKTSEVTEPDTSTLKNGELGRMYNEFYMQYL